MPGTIDWDKVKTSLSEIQIATDGLLRADPRRIDAAYRKRAAHLAARRVVEDAGSANLHLGFFLGAERYVIELSELSEILPLTKFTPVPAAPPALFGVINLRGEIVPIVDLARVLELDAVGPEGAAGGTSQGYVLLLKRPGFRAGLKVDRMQEVRNIPSSDLLAANEALSGRSRRYIKGITQDTALLLDLDAVLAHSVFVAG